MLRLKLVKGIDLVGEEDNDDKQNNESSLLHAGTQVLSHLGSVQIALFVQTLTSLLLERRMNSTETASVSSASSRLPREVSQKRSSLL